MTPDTFRLYYDEDGRIHVLNRTRAICKASVSWPCGDAKATKSQIANLLRRLDEGCMDCAIAITGAKLRESRYEV
jgi:hypothetical protein